ncbi:hypothetical protein BJ322DRAFT_1010472, partial [Thelephora terrestris]
KWFEIYGLMNRSRTAILAIQESHLTDNLAASISRAFETKLSLFHSALPEMNNAAGVAFVSNRGLINPDLTTCEEIIPGRAILTKVQWHSGSTIKILNIYTPNITKDNEKFWEDLKDITARNLALKPNLMLGDFNLVEGCLDRLPSLGARVGLLCQ